MRSLLLQTAASALLFTFNPQTALSSVALKDGLSNTPLLLNPQLPGGTPLSLCAESRPSDLFHITSVELTRQPVYIDDVFTVHIYGIFQHSFKPNATLNVTVDCGSHCTEYGVHPGEPKGESWVADFCDLSMIEQPLGGRKKNATCPPEEGYALITSFGYVMPMFISTPAWYNFTFDAKTVNGDRIYCLTAEVYLRWEDEEKNKHYPPGPWNHCRWP